MNKIKKFKYPIILTLLSFSLLITFQRCGGGSDGGSGSAQSGTNSSPVVVTSTFAPDSYFTEYKNFGGTSDSVIIGFILASDNQFTGYKVRFINGNYTVGYYQISKGTYQLTSENHFSVTYNKDTCNDLAPEAFSISGISGDFVYLKQDSTSIKFLSEKKWQPSAKFQTNNAALVEDTECNKF